MLSSTPNTTAQQALDSIFGDDFLASLDHALTIDPDHVKKFDEDPFVLSMAAWRTTVECDFIIRWPELKTVKVKEEDRVRAEAMKRYYRDRMMVRALKNSKLTPFCQDLYDLVLTGEVKNKHMGMLMRLPFFYQEDLDYEELTKKVAHIQRKPLNLAQALIAVDPERRRLTPVKKIFHGRKNGELLQYWFIDELNRPVLWSVKLGNALGSLVEGIFQEPACVIDAVYHTGQLRGVEFAHFYMSGPRIVF